MLQQGHTEQITCVESLPGTGGSVLITAGPSKDVSMAHPSTPGGSCSSTTTTSSWCCSRCPSHINLHIFAIVCFRDVSRPLNHHGPVPLFLLQIRLIDLQREAVRPYSSHSSAVHSLLPLSTAVFASGGADGAVRCHDSRVNSRGGSQNDAGQDSLLGRCRAYICMQQQMCWIAWQAFMFEVTSCAAAVEVKAMPVLFGWCCAYIFTRKWRAVLWGNL